jgi:hypothetical protein
MDFGRAIALGTAQLCSVSEVAKKAKTAALAVFTGKQVSASAALTPSFLRRML